MIKKSFFYILLIIPFMLFSCKSDYSGKVGPLAEKGVLDLTQWDFEKDGSVQLNGKWEFYWEKFLKPEDFNNKNSELTPVYIVVPGSWSNNSINGKRKPPDGFATYRIIIATDKLPQNNEFSIKFLPVSTAYKLFINGKEMSTVGKPGMNKDETIPRDSYNIIHFYLQKPHNEIVIQVANFHFYYGGLTAPVTLGTSHQINNASNKNIALEIFLLGSFLIISLYHLGMYLYRKEDKSSLNFSICCIVIIVYTLLRGELLLLYFNDVATWRIYKAFENIAVNLIPLFILQFIFSLFPKESNKIIFSVLRYFFVILIIFSAFIFIPISFFIDNFINVLILFTGMSCITVIVKSIKAGEDGAWLIFTGFIIFFTIGINDILYVQKVINTGFYLSYGLFIFILSQALSLAIRFSKAFITVEHLSRDLEEKNIRLNELDRLKDEFLSNTSHELRTPLHGIIGIAESLYDGALGVLSNGVKSNLGMIISSGTRLSHLVNDILDFSKLKNRDLVLLKRAVDIRELAEIVLKLSAPLVTGKNVALINSIPGSLPLVWGDEERLQQIFHNIIGNAIKFTEKGSIEVTAHLEGDCQSGTDFLLDGCVVISVRDTGVGIPEDKQQRIFEPFEQAVASTIREFGGTGLGLSITRKLIELHGGAIRVESQPGAGSTFNFSIPVAPPDLEKKDEGGRQFNRLAIDTTLQRGEERRFGDDLAEEENRRRNALRERREMNISGTLDGVTVLAVDDESVNLQVIENNLHLAGAEVISAISGDDALEKLEHCKPDIILLDIMMPRMNGFDTMEKIREKHSKEDLPVIFLTAKNQVSDLVQGFSQGVNDYIVKPFSKNELITRISFHVSFKKAILEGKQLMLLEKELEVARRIQLAALPQGLPHLKNFSVAARYISAAIVSGDFYDIHTLDDNRIGCFVSDITGHGIAAAIIASMVKVIFHMQRDIADNPSKFLEKMNEYLTGNIEDKYMTAGYVYIDREKMKLFHASAGHEPLIILRGPQKQYLISKPKGHIIGLSRSSAFEVEEIDLEIGDRIILYTDGIIENFNSKREQFGRENLEALILETSEYTSEECIDTIILRMKEWNGQDEFNDDITIVAIDIR